MCAAREAEAINRNGNGQHSKNLTRHAPFARADEHNQRNDSRDDLRKEILRMRLEVQAALISRGSKSSKP
jgi:hypothetical protein